MKGTMLKLHWSYFHNAISNFCGFCCYFRYLVDKEKKIPLLPARVNRYAAEKKGEKAQGAWATFEGDLTCLSAAAYNCKAEFHCQFA